MKASQLRSTLARGSPPALTAGTPSTLSDTEREACFLGKNWERSERACTALLAMSELEAKDEVLIRRRRGIILIELKQFDKAINELSRAIMLNPKDAFTYNNRGAAYDSKGEFDRAIADFNKVIELNPKEVAGWRNRALLRALTSDFHGAMADISEALRLAPQDARTLYVRGILLELRGNPSDAAQAFTAARIAVQHDAEWSQIEHDLRHYRSRR